jgi:hypothetical protein
MSVTQADLDDLEAAIASGTLRVRDRNGSEIQYRNLDDMIRTANRLREQLGLTSPGGITVSYPGYKSGLHNC